MSYFTHKAVAMLAALLMMVPCVAQPTDTPAADAQKSSSEKSTPKPKKVWTNEDLGGLGVVNVVGKAAPQGRSAGRGGAQEGSVMDRPRPAGPQFTATSLDGQTFNSDSTYGKAVLVQFWATYCGYCQQDQPAVDALASRPNLVVLAVTIERKDVVQNYLSTYPRSSYVVMGRDTNLHQLFPTSGVPYYVMIDREGKVVARHPGLAGEARLATMLSKAGV